jgi:HlyD family secretion protein
MSARHARKINVVAALLLTTLMAGGAVAAYYRYGRTALPTERPTAVARKGEFLVIVTCRGDLVARRSVVINAPNVPDLRIISQVAADSAVKEGDTLIKFDASSAQRQLQEKEATLKQTQASLDQAIAMARITEEQDKLELAAARHAVERARLEVSKAEIVSRLQAEESRIEFGLAEEKLKVQQATLEMNKASSASKVASLQSQRDKTQAEVDLTLRRISRMEMKSPSSGVINYLMNTSQGWMNAKPFRVGDNVWPGSSVAEIPDLQTLQLKAKVEEIERGKIQPGQAVRIHLDPFPEKPFPGKLASISPLTEQNFEWPPSRNFRAYADFNDIDKRLRPGMNGRVDIVVDRIADAISVPSKAVKVRQGKPAVLVLRGTEVVPVQIEVIARNPDEVAVKGIEAGTSVVLTEDESAPAADKGGKK